MTLLLPLLALLGIGIYLYSLYAAGKIPALLRALRWVVGGGALTTALVLALARNFGLASLVGAAGASVLMRGQLGPIDFNPSGAATGNISRVKSHFFAMTLDHDAGTVSGRVTSGQFKGRDLMDLGPDDTKQLLAEVGGDADSLALLETWLDANRAGWREYFAAGEEEASAAGSGPAEGPMTEAQALDILGLSKGATNEDIRAAHRRLLMAVHPDHGGSGFLAARINAAKDFLLKAKG